MSKKLVKPTMYHQGTEYGEVFWNNQNEEVVYIHENDGNYRSEYMDPLFKMFGIQVKYNNNKLPRHVKEEVQIWEPTKGEKK